MGDVLRVLTLTVATVLVLAGCGDDSEGATTTAPAPEATAAPTTAAPPTTEAAPATTAPATTAPATTIAEEAPATTAPSSLATLVAIMQSIEDSAIPADWVVEQNPPLDGVALPAVPEGEAAESIIAKDSASNAQVILTGRKYVDDVEAGRSHREGQIELLNEPGISDLIELLRQELGIAEEVSPLVDTTTREGAFATLVVELNGFTVEYFSKVDGDLAFFGRVVGPSDFDRDPLLMEIFAFLPGG